MAKLTDQQKQDFKAKIGDPSKIKGPDGKPLNLDTIEDTEVLSLSMDLNGELGEALDDIETKYQKLVADGAGEGLSLSAERRDEITENITNKCEALATKHNISDAVRDEIRDVFTSNDGLMLSRDGEGKSNVNEVLETIFKNLAQRKINKAGERSPAQSTKELILSRRARPDNDEDCSEEDIEDAGKLADKFQNNMRSARGLGSN